jgi:multidrug efflux system outer membrane protein
MRVHPFKLHTIALAALLAGLVGCATPGAPADERSSAGTLPALTPSSSAQRAELSIERWWAAFNDAQLDALIDSALQHNTDLELALARVREAQAGIDAARARQSPTLDARVESQRSRASTVGAQPLPPGTDRHVSSHGVSLITGYEADLWGQLSQQTQAARSRLLASQWARASTEWSLTAQVAESYFALVAVDRQIHISTAVRDSRITTLQLRQREINAGAGNEFDLRRSEAEVTSAEATLAQLNRQRVSLERALALLAGQTPETARAIARSTLDESQLGPALLPQTGVERLLQRRPDIQQAEANLLASNADVAAARAGAYPRLAFSGVIGHDARSLSDLFSGPSLLWNIAASATQSLFDGGRVQSQVDAERARQQQAQINYRKTVTGAYFDLREAYQALDHTQQAYHAEGARVVSLTRAREIALTGFGAGAYSYLDVLDAERNLYQARLQRVDAHRDRLTAQVAIYKAFGGGYTRPDATANRNTGSDHKS